jgi:hypothetical protein
MTEPSPAPRDPSRRDRTRPAELLGLSAVLATVLGLVVFAATRQFVLALEFFGIGFIGSVVVMAMLLLAVTPNEKKGDGSDPPRGGH